MTNNDDKRKESLHLNYAVITENIEQKSRVLDLGCGSGDLLKMLVEKKHCTGLGIDIDQQNVIETLWQVRQIQQRPSSSHCLLYFGI